MFGRDLLSPMGIRFLLLLSFWLAIAGYKSWQDFRFATVGRQATATITKIVDERNRPGRNAPNYVTLSYDFFNAETGNVSHHHTSIDVDAINGYVPGKEVIIDYYGGAEPNSRLHGTNHLGWVCLFIGTAVVLTAVILDSVFAARRCRRQSPS